MTSGNPSVDVAPAFSDYNLPGAKGSLYKQGTYGDTKLLGGGDYNNAEGCGSRARATNGSRWNTASSFGGRFVAEPH